MENMWHRLPVMNMAQLFQARFLPGNLKGWLVGSGYLTGHSSQPEAVLSSVNQYTLPSLLSVVNVKLGVCAIPIFFCY